MIWSIEKSNDLIGTRTRDLPVCSILPQPTKLLRAPLMTLSVCIKYGVAWYDGQIGKDLEASGCDLIAVLPGHLTGGLKKSKKNIRITGALGKIQPNN
jgi:hypothetical protein